MNDAPVSLGRRRRGRGRQGDGRLGRGEGAKRRARIEATGWSSTGGDCTVNRGCLWTGCKENNVSLSYIWYTYKGEAQR